MAVIWQSGEFWLMIGAVLLVIVGCTALRNRTPFVPAEMPHNVTLTQTPFPTLLPNTVYTNPTWLDETFGRSSLPPPNSEIFVSEPSCYSLSGGQYSCLGQIWNNSANNLGDTNLHLAFFAADGTQIGTRLTTSEQRITLTGSSAPYRALIDGNISAEMNDETRILTTLSRTLPPAANIQALSITEARGMITEAGRYSLSVTILNDSGFVAQNIRLFTTLDGAEWGVVGYSVHEVENSMENGEQQLIQLEVIPHALPEEINHFLHVEATITE